MAMDEKCNDAESASVTLNVLDLEPPRARIAGFDPWWMSHGDEPTTYCDIYAIAYSDAAITNVQFQYAIFDGVELGEWIPIGISEDLEPDCGSAPDCDVWYTTIDLATFQLDELMHVAMRAIATDDMDLMDPDPPYVRLSVVEYEDGTLDLIDMRPYGYEGLLRDGSLRMVGGDDTDQVLVTVSVVDSEGEPDATQMPHMLFIKPHTVADGGGACCVTPMRHIDEGNTWSGEFTVPDDDCGKMAVFATALSEDGWLDLYRAYIWSWELTDELGTNGTASVPGYMAVGDSVVTYLDATFTAPGGSGSPGYCLFMMPTDPPQVGVQQERFLTLLDRTAYFIGFVDYDYSFNNGYWPVVTIEYDDEAVVAAFGDDAAAKEPYLTPRVWNDSGGWGGGSISHVSVDTEANVVSFRVASLDDDSPFYALFGPVSGAPVGISGFKPSSVRYGRWNYTDADPVISAQLTSGGTEPIDHHSVELWIDDLLWAATLDEGSWVRGNGRFDVEQANAEGTIYQVVYRHSFLQEDWLLEGWHTLNIMFKHEGGSDEWVSLLAGAPGGQFYVDRTAPYVEFHGGFVNNPLFANVSGYLNPAESNDMLTVKMWDEASGIYVRPDHPEWVWDRDCDDGRFPGPEDEMWPGEDEYYDDGCWVEVDYGIKYDLWLVHARDITGDEDDQLDIDEIEERLLLHTGTADELLPYLDPPLLGENAYMPEDTLFVGLPIIGGTGIEDGDIIEVAIYSHKLIEQHSDDEGVHTRVDTVWTEGNEYYLLIWDEYWDDESQEMHTYENGVIDCAWNSGSKYVEQRFLVDMTGPEVKLISPPEGSVAPGEDFCVTVGFEDSGSGVADVEVVLVGPKGEEIEPVEEPTVGDDTFTACFEGVSAGLYSLNVTATDGTGGTTKVSIPLTSQSRTLGLTQTYMWPNPFNPVDLEANVHFNLNRAADVTIKVYDFAGEYVGNVITNAAYEAGTWNVPWAGQASNGRDLANGAYMIRVEAKDASALRGATIKAVIWRE